MGRRSRRRPPGGSRTERARPPASRTTRSDAAGRDARASPGPLTPRRRARLEERPPAPWAPLPLTELCLLVGLVLLGVGVLGAGSREVALVGTGGALIALGTLEFTVREHLAGYRSHTTLLSALAGVAVMSGLALAKVSGAILSLAIGIVVAALTGWVLREVFRRRAGGLSFRA